MSYTYGHCPFCASKGYPRRRLVTSPAGVRCLSCMNLVEEAPMSYDAGSYDHGHDDHAEETARLRRIHNPSWFLLVEDEYNKLELGGPVNLEPEHVEPLWLQAWPAAEMAVEDEIATDHEAARRVALAIALLAYGEGVLASLQPSSPPDTSELPLGPGEAEEAFGAVTGSSPRAADLAVVASLGNTRGVLAEYVWDHWFGEPEDLTPTEILEEIDQHLAKMDNA